MKALGHCTGITALTSTGWVTITGARLGLRGEMGNWWSIKTGAQWGTMEETGKLQTLNINIKTGIKTGVQWGTMEETGKL